MGKKGIRLENYTKVPSLGDQFIDYLTIIRRSYPGWVDTPTEV
ncbi:hypothetical protein ES705_16894 [subsurface metagenome]